MSETTIPHSPSAAAQPLPVLDGYEIIAPLGRGGMGIVYDAYQHATGRRVALKFMQEGATASEATRQRFEREVELVARLSHPHIVSIIDSGVHSGRYWYAMEYIDGAPLDRWILDFGFSILDSKAAKSGGDASGERGFQSKLQNPKSKMDAMLRLLATICDAVDHAHQHGVLHRDLKPSNILVVEQGSGFRVQGSESTGGAGVPARPLNPEPRTLNPQPKILDFGLAKAIDPAAGSSADVTLSEPGQLLGTLGYMSPEQARGQIDAVSVRSDVYSLGAIAYEALTGRLPCPTDGPLGEVLRRIAEQDPPRPSLLSRGLSADVDAILLKSLDKSPQRRYASTSALAAEFRRYLNNEPIHAHPPNRWYEFQKFARRNRAIVLGTLAVFLTLIAGIVGTSWQALRATRAEYDAREKATRALEAGRTATRERDSANRARDEARAEASKASAISQFLKGMLESIDPSLARGADTTLFRAMLARASEWVGTDLADQPEAQASIRSTLGNLYRNLGQLDEAEQHLRAAIKLDERFNTRDVCGQLLSIQHLAAVLADRGRFRESEELWRRALTRRQAEPVGTSCYMTSAMTGLSIALYYQGKHSEARELVREVINRVKPDTEAGDRALLASTNNLAMILKETGDFAAAESLLRHVLGESREHYGNDAPISLGMMSNLVQVLQRTGRLAEAEPLAREALVNSSRVLGEKHHATLTAMNQLGLVLKLRGRLAEAEDWCCRAVQLWRQLIGDEDQHALVMTVNLAEVLLARGKLVDAEQHFEEALGAAQRALGATHPTTLRTLFELAYLRRVQGRLAESETLLRDLLVTQTAVLGEEHPDALATLCDLASVLGDQNKAGEAILLYQTVLETYRRVLGTNHADTLVTMNHLVEAFLRDGRAAEAEALAVETVQRARGLFRDADYRRWLFERTLGICLVQLGRYEDAEEHLVLAYDGLRAAFGSGHRHVENARLSLVQLYESWGLPEKAAKYRIVTPDVPATAQ